MGAEVTMVVEIRETFAVEAPVERVFGRVASVEGMELFTGWGMIPGIARVEPSAPARAVGVEDLVINTDGTRHRERVTALDAPWVYGVRIGPFESPLARLVDRMDERWELERRGHATVVRRSFRVVPQGRLAALFVRVVFGPQLRRAMRRHHAALQEDQRKALDRDIVPGQATREVPGLSM
jgi:Polyketide cyclase / dehydrase and lipid transport